MPTTIGIETLFDVLPANDAAVAADPVVIEVITVEEVIVVAVVTMVAGVSVVVMATGGTSVGSRTVYLMSRNIIKFTSCHRQKRTASHESIYDDKLRASRRHGGDDGM
jgi:hypothetical protein